MKKLSLTQKILEKNYIVLIISVVISISIWVYMSMNATNDTTLTISNIPVQVELSDSAKELGLRVFTGSDLTASVTLSGNRTILGTVDASDVTVTAAANSVNSSGNYTLPISAAKTTASMNFQITQSTPSSVNVYVDYFKESTFPIQDGIILNVSEGYYATTSMPYSQVNISGPQTEINKIKKVVAKADIDKKLTESVDVDANIVLYDENDNELPTQLLTMSTKSFTANIEVLPEKRVPINPVFINKPDGLDFDSDTLEITPSELLLAGPEDVLDKIEFINTDSLDFSTLNNRRFTFNTLSVDVPDKCKNISNSSSVQMVLDLSGFVSTTLEVDNFTVTGLSSQYTSTVTSKSVTVTVIGPKDEIDELEASDITAVIDTTDANGKTGSVEMPVTFRFNGTNSCWCYGKYQANLTITEK